MEMCRCGVWMELRGVGQDKYDAVIRDLDLGGKAHKGGLPHG